MPSLALAIGPIAAAAAYGALPRSYENEVGDIVQFTHAGRATVALLVWMGIWWITEAVDLAVTALLPLAMLPLLGAASMQDAAVPYGSDLIFLFMGGFIMAIAMQRWGLDRRIAFLTLRMAGAKPINLVGACMLATAVIAGFVSNTATTAMMLPIGLSVIALFKEADAAEETAAGWTNFAACMVLGIAYASAIGGIKTLIGTPPNTFLAAFVRDHMPEPHRQEITFLQWLAIGLPLTAALLPIAWVLLTRIVLPIRMPALAGGADLIRQERGRLGPMGRGEWATLLVFLSVAFAWVARPWLVAIELPGGSSVRPLGGLTDSGIAVLGALALFVIPAGRGVGGMVMDWPSASKLPWGTLILFGGGLSLAAAIERNGVAEFLGSQARWFTFAPEVVIVAVVVASVVALSEVASNTATASALIPVLASLAPGLGIHPYLLLFPATMAASLAFMMPVGTPPNAMALGTGMVTMRQMIKAGLWLNLIGIALITLWSQVLVKPLLID